MEGYVNLKIKVSKWSTNYVCTLLAYGFFFYIKAIRASLKHEINEHQGFLAVYVVNKTIATLVNNR